MEQNGRSSICRLHFCSNPTWKTYLFQQIFYVVCLVGLPCIPLWLALHDIPSVGMIPTSKSLYISQYSIFMSVPWHPLASMGADGGLKKKQPSRTWPWSAHSSGPTWGMLYPQPSLRLLFSFRKFDQPQAVNLRINKDCSLSCSSLTLASFAFQVACSSKRNDDRWYGKKDMGTPAGWLRGSIGSTLSFQVMSPNESKWAWVKGMIPMK